jgi:agmatinase
MPPEKPMSHSDFIAANFLGIPPEKSSYKAARLVVLPIGFESTTTYGTGTRAGPDAILAASRQVEPWDSDLGVNMAEAPIHTTPHVAPDLSSPDAMTERLHRVAARCAADGKWVLGLGGEHSVSLGLVRGTAQEHGRLSILHIDAHCDLWPKYQGTPYSHACVMRRIVEDGHRSVHVGIRNAGREEVEFAAAHKLPIFWARQCQAGGAWIDRVVAALKSPVYISFDVDGLDPAVIRTTGTPEPGGLAWWDTMTLLERVFARHTVVGADVVELASAGDAASDFAAARLARGLRHGLFRLPIAGWHGHALPLRDHDERGQPDQPPWSRDTA